MSIEVRNVVYEYRDGTRALQGAELTIQPGERVAIIGQNGAGKTTIAKMMNGLLKPTHGDVRVDGVSTKDTTTAQIARRVAYVFQNPDDQLFKSRVYDEIEYLGKVLSIPPGEVEEKVAEVAALAGVDEYMDQNPKDLPLAIRKFVAIAALLMGRADYVVLDEPTAGLDSIGGLKLVRIMEKLTADHVAIVAICHDMRFVIEHFDRVIAMANGKVVGTGTPVDIFADDGVLSQCAVKRPEATQLARELGLPPHMITLDDVRQRLAAMSQNSE